MKLKIKKHSAGLIPCCWLLLMLLAGRPAVSQSTTPVTGTVLTEKGEALEGVTVLARGTGKSKSLQSALSNANGVFTFRQLTVGEQYDFTFSFIGYENDVLKGFVVKQAGASNTLLVRLKNKSAELNEVVVTALGIKRDPRGLGYSAPQISGDKLTQAISGNWTDALSGKVAGLNLVRSNSGPAGTNKIILRGEGNLTNSEDNEALIVVDGVVINKGSGRRTAVDGESPYGTSSDNMPADYGSSINDINPEDVESYTILKGAAAAALYGQRGGAGAIIITTKSGSIKRKGLGVTVNSNASIEQINRWPDLQYEYGQGLAGADYYSFGASADGASTSATSSAYGPRFNGQQFFQYDPVKQAQGTERTPWVAYPNQTRDFFNTGNSLTNTISLDGGTDKTSARFSFTNVANNWILPNTGYKRNTVSLSVNSKVNDRLQITSKINYTNKTSDNLPGAGYGNQSIMYWYIFWQPSADLNWLKNYWANGQVGRKIAFPFSSFPENPYAVTNEFINSTNRNGVTGNIQATYNFTKTLSLLVRTSMDLSYEQRAQQRPYDAGSKLPKGSYRTQNIFSQEATTDFLLKYTPKTGNDFNLSFTAGGSTLRNNYNKDENRADSLTYPGVYTFGNAAGPLIVIPVKSKYRINSFYGLLTADYKKLVYMDITARQDWNSVLATPLRTDRASFFYPSVSTSVIASDIFRLPSYVSYLKWRFSVAGVGSGSTTPYRTSFSYEPVPGSNGGLRNPSVLVNPNLSPLKTITFETGLEIKLLQDRLGLDITLYSGNTRDQILERVADRASGYRALIINAGRVDNRGIELALNGTILNARNGLGWTTGLVFSSNKNKITQLADSSVVLRTGPVGGGQIVAKVGGSMGDVYGRGYQRSEDGQVVYDPNTGVALLTQDVKYLGNTIPKWKMGFTNEFRYKAFRLNLLFDAQYGGVSHSLTHYKLAEQGKTTNTLPGRYNGIIGNGVVMGTDGKYRTNDVIATNIDEYYRSHYGIDNAEGNMFRTDFIKFREARLDFTLNSKLVKRLGMQRAVIGVYGRDLFIWSDWPIFDPEFGTLSGTDIVQGFEIGQFPSSRSIGVNLVIGL